MIDVTRMHSRIYLLAGLMLTLSLTLLPLHQDAGRWLQRLELLYYDWRFINVPLPFAKTAADIPVVIVDIDEASLAEVGRWPWSRVELANLIDALAGYGAIVIGLDLVLSEAEPHPADLLLRMGNKLDPEQRSLIQTLRSRITGADQQLADAIAQVDLVSGFFFLESVGINAPMPPPLKSLDPAQPYLYLTRPGVTVPLPVFRQMPGSTGFVSTFADEDGVIRRSPVLMSWQQQLYPSLSLAMAMMYLLEPRLRLQEVAVGNALAPEFLWLGDYRIRLDVNGRVIVPYAGPKGSFSYLPAVDVMRYRLDGRSLNGALVLVGSSAMGLADLRSTPVGTQYPGVEVHANILRGLLSGQFPWRPLAQAGLTFAQTLLAGLLLIVLLPRLAPSGALLVSIVLICSLLMTNLLLWHYYGLDLPVATTLLLCVCLVMLNLGTGLLSENRRRRQLRSIFDQYVPPAHIGKLLEDPEALQLAGETRTMTVLFSDICAFTRISEGMTANSLKTMLNEHFTPLTRIIFEQGGTIDKYVGDMLMAFWGAPLDDPQHASHAVAAALSMAVQIEERQAYFGERGWPEVRVGIGINTGAMNVGDMGSDYRRAYTVLGDAVNLGSRLEGLTRYYGVTVLASDETRRAAPGFVWRFIDRIRVKGKEEAVDVYEPLGMMSAGVSRDDELAVWDQCLGFYRQQQWADALRLCQILQTQYPSPLYDVYAQRLQAWRVCPPDDWDGAYRHLSK